MTKRWGCKDHLFCRHTCNWEHSSSLSMTVKTTAHLNHNWTHVHSLKLCNNPHLFSNCSAHAPGPTLHSYSILFFVHCIICKRCPLLLHPRMCSCLKLMCVDLLWFWIVIYLNNTTVLQSVNVSASGMLHGAKYTHSHFKKRDFTFNSNSKRLGQK